MEERSYHGDWWLPGKKSDSVGGVIRYEPSDGIELRLFGSLDDSNDPLRAYHEEKIFGEVVEGKAITLSNCVVSGGRHNLGGVQTVEQKFETNLMFVGGHLDTYEFDHFEVTFPNLEEWSEMSTISVDFNENNSTVEARSDLPEKITVETSDAEVSLKATLTASDDRPRRFTYEQTSSFEISPDDKIDYNDARDTIEKLQNFLSLAVNTPVFPRNVSGYIEWSTNYPSAEVEVFYKIPRYEQPEEVDTSYDLHFSRTDIPFQRVLSSWFSHAEEAESIHNLYFSLIYSSMMPVHYKFLSLAIAIEAYHDHLFPDSTRMEKAEYNNVFEDLLDAIPEDVPLKSRIDGLQGLINQYSYREKTEAVAFEHEDILSEIIDIEDVVSEVTNTRHGWVHSHHLEETGAASQPHELDELLHKIQMVIEAGLYKELELDEDQIIQILTKKHGWVVS